MTSIRYELTQGSKVTFNNAPNKVFTIDKTLGVFLVLKDENNQKIPFKDWYGTEQEQLTKSKYEYGTIYCHENQVQKVT